MARRRHRRFATFFALCCAAATSAPKPLAWSAEPARPAAPVASTNDVDDRRPIEEWMEAIRELDLNADQDRQVRMLLQEARAALRQARDDVKSMPPQEGRAVVREQMDGLRRKIEGVLNESQRKTFDEHLRSMQARREERRRDAKASAAPATRPALDAPPTPAAGRGPAGPVVARLEKALAEVGLTAEQRPAVEKVLRELRDGVAKLRDDPSIGDPETLREKARHLQRQTREKLAGILTPEQFDKVRDALPGRPNDNRPDVNRPGSPEAPRGGDSPATRPATMGDPTMGDTMMGGSDTMMGGAMTGGVMTDDPKTGGAPNAARRPAPGDAPAATLGVGDVMPSFELVRLDGKPFSSRNLAGKPAVILFGSYSSPTFRERLPKLDELAKKYRNRVTFIVVYTAEAHPAGEWEPQRNVDDNVNIRAHVDLDARRAAARTARDKLKPANIDVLPEPMDEPLSRPLAARPDGAVVLDAKGVIVAQQKWAEASGLEIHLQGLVRE